MKLTTISALLQSQEFCAIKAKLISMGYEFGFEKYIQPFVPELLENLYSVITNLPVSNWAVGDGEQQYFETLIQNLPRWCVSDQFVALLLVFYWLPYDVNTCDLVNYGFHESIAERVANALQSKKKMEKKADGGNGKAGS